MSLIPPDLRYTREHEWASLGEDGTVKVGFTDFAQEAPLSGSVASLNAECRDNPALVNQDPYGEGWLVAIDPGESGDYEGLLTAEQYGALVQELEGDAGA